MIAGAARMDNRRYILANAVGALCWVPSLILLGFYGAGLLDTAPWLKPAAAVLAVAGFVGGSAVGLYRFRQEMRRPIDEGARHPEAAFRDGTPRREGGGAPPPGGRVRGGPPPP